jgi:hypothetical protein
MVLRLGMWLRLAGGSQLLLLAVVIGYVVQRFMVKEMVSMVGRFLPARWLFVVVCPVVMLAVIGSTGPAEAAAADGRLSQGSTSGSQLRQLSLVRAPGRAAGAFGARVASRRRAT